MLWASVTAVLFFAATLMAKADIKIERKQDDISVSISGTITERDAQQFRDVSTEFENAELSVFLNSRGGDVSAAMQIGRLIRKYDGWTWIMLPWLANASDIKCYSSCALIFIAGVHRWNEGKLGLHRPYFASAPGSRETVETQFPIMLSTIKSYVAEMGITDNFYQQMVNTEPAEMVIYDSGNYRKLVPEYDPVYAEVRIAYQARRYGITTSEMRAREQDAKACDSGWGQRANANFMGLVALPTSFDPGIDCEEAAKWGLSKRVYLERLANLHDCALSDEEKSKFAATPNKSKRDSPILLHFETCVRNIMLSR